MKSIIGLVSSSYFLRFLLLLFEIGDFNAPCSAADELNVPYVPYVVVDKHKDAFDYDRLQETIVRYLQQNPSRRDDLYGGAPPASSWYAASAVESATTLYDFLRTSTDYRSPAAEPISSPSASAYSTADKNGILGSYSNRVTNIDYSNDATRKPPSTVKDNSMVTAVMKVTTYQPYKFGLTPPPYPQYIFANANSNFTGKGNAKRTRNTPTAADDIRADETTFGAKRVRGSEHRPNPKFPLGSEMKCSLRSSRYVYDGDCVSKKPVVETVCADRCIRYEYHRKGKNPLLVAEHSNAGGLSNTTELRKKVVALSCKDGDVKKQKIKLYCKDGTIINNIIRIVNSCVCQEHSEKVHATKRHQRIGVETRKKPFQSAVPRIRMQPYF